MPHRIAWEQGGVCTTFSGSLTGSELIRYTEEICASSRFDDLQYEILDLCGLEAVAAGLEHLIECSASRIGAAVSNSGLSIYVVCGGAPGRDLVRRIEELRICPYPIVEFASLNDVRSALQSGAAEAPGGRDRHPGDAGSSGNGDR